MTLSTTGSGTRLPAVLSALVLTCALATGAAAQSAAGCDLSGLTCADGDKRCNLKFRNRTGVNEKIRCSNTSTRSVASASMIKVRVQDADRNDMGIVLTIEAGATNTLNLEKNKKQGFDRIRISTPNNPEPPPLSLSCDDVRALLEGNGTCKLYIDAADNPNKKAGDKSTPKKIFFLVAACDGGQLCFSSRPPPEDGTSGN